MPVDQIINTLETILNGNDSDKLVSTAWLFGNIDFNTIASAPPLLAFIDTLCARAVSDPWASIAMFEFLHSFTTDHSDKISPLMLDFIENVHLPADCSEIKQLIFNRVNTARAPSIV